jgi:hypothetical protein
VPVAQQTCICTHGVYMYLPGQCAAHGVRITCNGGVDMGCGASSGVAAGGRGFIDGQPPMVVVRERQQVQRGLKGLTRPPLTRGALERALRKGEGELKQQRRVIQDARLSDFLPERLASKRAHQVDFSYALGALVAVHTLREAAQREKVPEILRVSYIHRSLFLCERQGDGEEGGDGEGACHI